MADRLPLSIDGVLFAVVWTGMAVFVALHSVTLFQSSGERVVSMIRLAWFVGLCLVAAGAYAVIRGGSPATDA